MKLQQEKRKREQELLSIEKDYKNLHEEVDTLRQKFKDLKDRFLLKSQELEDYKTQYNEDKSEYHYIIKQKDKQIKKMQKMLETVLEEQTYKKVVDQTEESGVSQNESSYSSKKLFPNMKVQNKAKVKFNQMNLYKEAETQRSTPRTSFRQSNNQFISSKKERFSLDRPQEPKNYDSEHEKRVMKKVEETKQKYKSLTNLKGIDKQKQKKNRIKKVDSMISLKPNKGTKLPFITEVKKMVTSRGKQDSSDNYASRMGIDLGRIKNEILSEFRVGKSKNY